MVRYLLELLEMRRQLVSDHRILIHFTDRELEDVGLIRGDVSCRSGGEPWCSRSDRRRPGYNAGIPSVD